jgi:hypothetical protein
MEIKNLSGMNRYGDTNAYSPNRNYTAMGHSSVHKNFSGS